METLALEFKGTVDVVTYDVRRWRRCRQWRWRLER
jgi:hypothetical protein